MKSENTQTKPNYYGCVGNIKNNFLSGTLSGVGREGRDVAVGVTKGMKGFYDFRIPPQDERSCVPPSATALLSELSPGMRLSSIPQLLLLQRGLRMILASI